MWSDPAFKIDLASWPIAIYFTTLTISKLWNIKMFKSLKEVLHKSVLNRCYLARDNRKRWLSSLPFAK